MGLQIGCLLALLEASLETILCSHVGEGAGARTLSTTRARNCITNSDDQEKSEHLLLLKLMKLYHKEAWMHPKLSHYNLMALSVFTLLFCC